MPALIQNCVERSTKEIRSNRRLFVADLVGSAGAVLLAMLLQVGWTNWSVAAALVAITLASTAAALPVFGLYRRHLASVSLRDIASIVKGAFATCLIAGLLWIALSGSPGVWATVFVVQFFIAVPIFGGLRVAARRGEFFFVRPAEQTPARAGIPTLLVGTGASCDLFLRAVLRDRNATHAPVGILDDNRETQGLFFHDVPILGSIRDIDTALARMEAEGIRPRKLVLTQPVTQYESDEFQKLLDWADRKAIKVAKLPGLGELQDVTDDPNGTTVREVDVMDVLPRPQKQINRGSLRRMVQGRRVLVTGAGGSIGKELSRQIASLAPAEIVLVENCEYNLYAVDMDLRQSYAAVPVFAEICDIRDRERIMRIFDAHRPELVFNAAALKHVPMVEANPCEGVLTNAIGARNVADAACRHQALAMVQVSTDKAVNTTNVMGATKRVAEFYGQALDRSSEPMCGGTRFMTVRFGNVLGSSGSLIPLFQRQIMMGGPLTVTDPRMERFFMTIREAVELTLLASAHGLQDQIGKGEIFVLDMGEPVRIMDVAQRMIRLAGLRPGKDIDIEIVGIRQGEKLFEELFDSAETVRESSIEGVRAAAPAGVPLSKLQSAMADLEATARDGDAAGVIAILSDLVPGYAPECPGGRSQTAAA
ncbi:polysaccharide biosynthesis protein [Oceanomicrobium pacificus]|uniref:Polysaccharide biosynthesis protein n=1 Tax=Oceanomicrobium pacificus TaxID=2692916 RepID=A0A6B0TVF5_9RHOB|nr:nucleoside-diphosphate sugar epimerase/dehydratase [Oceanomicrobium pacificus]MXU65202.1 polysaccharide biosynthesis protein [Oceanomicrobium pacificus]